MLAYAVASASTTSSITASDDLQPEAPALAASVFIVFAGLACACAVVMFRSPRSVMVWRSRDAATALKSSRAQATTTAPPKHRDRRLTSIGSLGPIYVRTAEKFYGINGARVIASMHIVMGHLYQMNALPDSAYLFSWGFTWVPWFFMLSGFVLTHARLQSKDPYRHESAILFLRKRTATVYPLYAMGLGVALVINWWRGYALPEWYELFAQGFFLQSWLPWLPERTVQVHCWFLSAMLPYWLLYDVLLHHIVFPITRIRPAGLVLVLLALPPWLVYIFPGSLPGGDPQWYSTHKTGVLTTRTDFAVVVLKFHPVCYVHVFIFGMVLARLRALVAEQVCTKQHDEILVAVLERLFRFVSSIWDFGLLEL